MKSDKVFNLIAGIALTVGVLGNIPALSPLSVSQELIGKFVIVALIAVFVIKNIWLKLFLLWCVIRTTPFPIPQTVVALYTTALYFVLFQIIVDNLNKQRIQTLLNVVCIIALIQVAMMTLQYLGIWFLLVPTSSDAGSWALSFFEGSRFPLQIPLNNQVYRDYMAGFTGNVNFASSLLGLCFPAFLRKWWCCAIPILLWGIYVCISIQGLVIMVACTCVYLFIRWGRKPGLIGTLCALFALVAYLTWKHELINPTLSNRTEIWGFYIKKLIPKRWIIGWGLGQAKYLWYIAIREMKGYYPWLHSHNEFITLWAETGIIGFGLMMAFLGVLGVKLARSFKNTAHNVFETISDSACLKTIKSGTVEKKIVFVGIIAGLLSCSVNFTAHLTIGIVFLMYLSMAEYLTRREA